MSKNLAELIDTDGELTESQKEVLEDLQAGNGTDNLTQDEFEKRVEKVRNGEFIPRRVNSWADLWDEF